MNLFPAGSLDDVLGGAGATKGEVHDFIRGSHGMFSRNGVSYIALGVCGDRVWILAGSTEEEITDLLQTAGIAEAEIIELSNLH